MTSRSQPPKATLRPPRSTDYEVGFAKPPEHTRFKPGRSGNPRGRPKGSRNRLPALNEERLKSIIVQEAYRTVTVNDRGRPVTISMAEAVVRSLAVAAAKGHQRSQRLFTELLQATEQANSAVFFEHLDAVIDYKKSWEDELDRCRQLGIAAPEPIPHPDHISIDWGTGQVRVNGPKTKEEKVRLDYLRAKKIEWAAEIKDVKDMLADPANADIRQVLLEDLEHAEKIYARISTVIKD